MGRAGGEGGGRAPAGGRNGPLGGLPPLGRGVPGVPGVLGPGHQATPTVVPDPLGEPGSRGWCRGPGWWRPIRPRSTPGSGPTRARGPPSTSGGGRPGPAAADLLLAPGPALPPGGTGHAVGRAVLVGTPAGRGGDDHGDAGRGPGRPFGPCRLRVADEGSARPAGVDGSTSSTPSGWSTSWPWLTSLVSSGRPVGGGPVSSDAGQGRPGTARLGRHAVLIEDDVAVQRAPQTLFCADSSRWRRGPRRPGSCAPAQG